MSTIKVNKIENTSTTNGGVSIDNDGHVTIDGQQLPTAGPLSNRNIIVNGGMTIAQRGNTVSSINSGTGYYTADRYRLDVTIGTWTSDRMTNSQNDTYEAGSTERFRNSMRLTCTSGNASPSGTDNVKVVYFVEGQDAQHLDYGTPNAKTATLSFWVKSNKTGTGTVELLQEDNNTKQYTASYTINAANTWEYKVITIPGDTAGLINNDSGRGLVIIWWLNSGSTYTGGSQGGWRAISNANRNSDNLAIGSSTNDEWFLTGVQLEVGSKSTPFEHRSYSDELARCKRYYQTNDTNYYFSAVSGGAMVAVFPEEMRAAPTMTQISGSGSFGNFSDIGKTNCSMTIGGGAGFFSIKWKAEAEL